MSARQRGLIPGMPLTVVTSTTGHEEGGWRKRAACAGVDPTLFFPPPSVPQEPIYRDYCDRCPVRQECLEEGVAGHEDGIWGGTSERERERIRRKKSRRT